MSIAKRLFRARLVAAILLLGAGSSIFPAGADAQRAGGTVRAARADFADLAQGTYLGEVASDSREPSRTGVRVTVAKIGPNRVRIASDHARLPAFAVQLTREADTLRDAGGGELFLLDLSKSPRTLAVRAGGASWAGVRE